FRRLQERLADRHLGVVDDGAVRTAVAPRHVHHLALLEPKRLGALRVQSSLHCEGGDPAGERHPAAVEVLVVATAEQEVHAQAIQITHQRRSKKEVIQAYGPYTRMTPFPGPRRTMSN